MVSTAVKTSVPPTVNVNETLVSMPPHTHCSCQLMTDVLKTW